MNCRPVRGALILISMYSAFSKIPIWVRLSWTERQCLKSRSWRVVTEAAHSLSPSLGPKCPTQLTLHSPRFHSNGMNGKKVTSVWRRPSWGDWPCLIPQLLLREGRPVQESPWHKHVQETHFPPTGREGWHPEETETRLLTWVNAPSWALLCLVS